MQDCDSTIPGAEGPGESSQDGCSWGLDMEGSAPLQCVGHRAVRVSQHEWDGAQGTAVSPELLSRYSFSQDYL